MSKRLRGRNPFYFFMLDWKTKQEKAGRTFPNDLRDVQKDPQCQLDWANISSEEKERYIDKAKRSKIAAQIELIKKTAIGEAIEDVKAAEKRAQTFYDCMMRAIKKLVADGVAKNLLFSTKFILIHTNWFYKRDTGINTYKYYPAEFAIAEFSLRHGIQNMYHEVINMGVPLGFRREFNELSQSTHKIPANLQEGQEDFRVIYDGFMNLFKRNMVDTTLPPIFTIGSLRDAVRSLVVQIDILGGRGFPIGDISIYSLEALFTELRNTATRNIDDRSIPLVVAQEEFNRDLFSSVVGLECTFHSRIDSTSQYCSMAIVKRWGFTICDHCCEYFNIPMKEGIHRPVDVPLGAAAVPMITRPEQRVVEQMENLRIEHDLGVVGMHGVSDEHRRRVSERTYTDEVRRRNNPNELDIIDHSNILQNNCAGRPLRLPTTLPRALSVQPASNSNSYFDEFPPLDLPSDGGEKISGLRNLNEILRTRLGRGRGQPR